MNINLNWKEECPHCAGTKTCFYYNSNHKETDECWEKCVKVYIYKYSPRKKESIKKLAPEKIICAVCKGEGYVLTAFGEQLKEFCDMYYWPNKEKEIAKMINDQAPASVSNAMFGSNVL